MTPDIVLVASATLALSFLCSMLEAVLYTVTPSQLEVMRRSGVSGANRFGRFRADVEEPIAAILTVNTVSNTAGAALCGWLVADHAGSAAVGVFTAVFTLLVLLVSEIVPKSLGVRFAPKLVPYLAWPLQALVWASLPAARSSKWLMQKLTGPGRHVHMPTTEEIIAMSKLAARVGELTTQEMLWIENALRLDQVAARDLLTPRTVVQTLTADEKISALVSTPDSMRHSRLPVTEGKSQDRLIGVVYRRDVFDAAAAGRADATVRELMREIDYVPEAMKGPQLLEKFILGKRHMVAVIDEYGGFEGIVTLEDVLESMLGDEIVDEHDEHRDMQEFARAQARARPSGTQVAADDER